MFTFKNVFSSTPEHKPTSEMSRWEKETFLSGKLISAIKENNLSAAKDAIGQGADVNFAEHNPMDSAMDMNIPLMNYKKQPIVLNPSFVCDIIVPSF